MGIPITVTITVLRRPINFHMSYKSLANPYYPPCSGNTAQKMKFSITDFFSKCDQIRSFLRIWSHLLKKSVMGNLIFCGE